MGTYYLAYNLGAVGVRRTQTSNNGRGERYEVWNVAQDTGCPLATSCLRCHLARCILDEPPKSRTAILQASGLNPWYSRKLFS